MALPYILQGKFERCKFHEKNCVDCFVFDALFDEMIEGFDHTFVYSNSLFGAKNIMDQYGNLWAISDYLKIHFKHILTHANMMMYNERVLQQREEIMIELPENNFTCPQGYLCCPQQKVARAYVPAVNVEDSFNNSNANNTHSYLKIFDLSNIVISEQRFQVDVTIGNKSVDGISVNLELNQETKKKFYFDRYVSFSSSSATSTEFLQKKTSNYKMVFQASFLDTVEESSNTSSIPPAGSPTGISDTWNPNDDIQRHIPKETRSRDCYNCDWEWSSEGYLTSPVFYTPRFPRHFSLYDLDRAKIVSKALFTGTDSFLSASSSPPRIILTNDNNDTGLLNFTHISSSGNVIRGANDLHGRRILPDTTTDPKAYFAPLYVHTNRKSAGFLEDTDRGGGDRDGEGGWGRCVNRIDMDELCYRTHVACEQSLGHITRLLHPGTLLPYHPYHEDDFFTFRQRMNVSYKDGFDQLYEVTSTAVPFVDIQKPIRLRLPVASQTHFRIRIPLHGNSSNSSNSDSTGTAGTPPLPLFVPLHPVPHIIGLTITTTPIPLSTSASFSPPPSIPASLPLPASPASPCAECVEGHITVQNVHGVDGEIEVSVVYASYVEPPPPASSRSAAYSAAQNRSIADALAHIRLSLGGNANLDDRTTPLHSVTHTLQTLVPTRMRLTVTGRTVLQLRANDTLTVPFRMRASYEEDIPLLLAHPEGVNLVVRVCVGKWVAHQRFFSLSTVLNIPRTKTIDWGEEEGENGSAGNKQSDADTCKVDDQLFQRYVYPVLYCGHGHQVGGDCVCHDGWHTRGVADQSHGFRFLTALHRTADQSLGLRSDISVSDNDSLASPLYSSEYYEHLQKIHFCNEYSERWRGRFRFEMDAREWGIVVACALGMPLLLLAIIYCRLCMCGVLRWLRRMKNIHRALRWEAKDARQGIREASMERAEEEQTRIHAVLEEKESKRIRVLQRKQKKKMMNKEKEKKGEKEEEGGKEKEEKREGEKESEKGEEGKGGNKGELEGEEKKEEKKKENKSGGVEEEKKGNKEEKSKENNNASLEGKGTRKRKKKTKEKGAEKEKEKEKSEGNKGGSEGKGVEKEKTKTNKGGSEGEKGKKGEKEKVKSKEKEREKEKKSKRGNLEEVEKKKKINHKKVSEKDENEKGRDEEKKN